MKNRRWLVVLGSLSCLLACLGVNAAEPSRTPYVETFDHGPGGWYSDRRYALSVWDGIAYCYSPWWVDANHAPPGAGYLHLIMWIYTGKKWANELNDYTRTLPYRGSSFVDENKSTNLTNARVSIRMRGDTDLKGAQLLLWVETQTKKTTANFALTGQPFKITHDWSDQTVNLVPDPKQWTCAGARHDMGNEYGCDDIATVLSDINIDLIFVLFPLKVVPAGVHIADINQ